MAQNSARLLDESGSSTTTSHRVGCLIRFAANEADAIGPGYYRGNPRRERPGGAVDASVAQARADGMEPAEGLAGVSTGISTGCDSKAAIVVSQGCIRRFHSFSVPSALALQFLVYLAQLEFDLQQLFAG